MGRSPCCSKEGLNRGAWTALEDKILMAYIKAHGEGKWRNLPERAGLKRCGKSCRLRWLNYLRPDIKRGNISLDEEELIIKLHNLLGNRWSLIAGRLTGRTDNEIKNYWNTTLGKKAKGQSSSQSKQSSQSKSRAIKPMTSTQPSKSTQTTQVIRTKATVCTKCAWKEMGRSPYCSKEGLNRGAWTALEDKILMAYIKAHGEGNWRNLPERAGLKRCGKSCRLRWLNYLRPDIKRGNISLDEEELIIRLHNLLGNRWSLIAGRLPGRTGNEIKNYWNTTLGKKARGQSSSRSKKSSQSKSRAIKPMTSTLPSKSTQTTQAIRAQATRGTKVLLSLQSPPPTRTSLPPPEILSSTAMNDPSQASLINHQQDGPNFYCGTEVVLACHDDSDFFDFGKWNEIQPNDIDGDTLMTSGCNRNLSGGSEYSLGLFDDLMLKDWALNHSPEDNATLDLESLAHLLDSEEWA